MYSAMDKKESLKRKRSENWIEADKMLLQQLIRKRVKEIEDKNTDTNTNQVKKKAWEEVEKSFNSLCTGGRRSHSQLKNQWTSIKVLARKRVAEHRKEIGKTEGGDAPPEAPVSSEDISVWLPNEFVGDSNEFDSDATPVETVEDECLENEPDEDESDTPEEVNIPQNFPTPRRNLKKKKPTKRERQTQEAVKRFTDFEMQCRRELHQLKMQAERKRIRNLDREYDLIDVKIKFYENYQSPHRPPLNQLEQQEELSIKIEDSILYE